MELLSTKEWGLGLNKEGRVLISGPCSAESEKQVLASCKGAKEGGADILRAGIWKPRTRPNSFEGIGEKGLFWLKQAGTECGLPVCIEVAKPKHIELALKADIDIFWLGARTTANPFAVQDLADALRGVDIPVMIKNPINPDLELWIGTIERIFYAGIEKIVAIHRGFSVTNSHPFRNAPMWEIPIELRRRMQELQIFCDPSHICGHRSMLRPITQRAIDLDFDGLMIETHIDPDNALSDALQQVTPQGLKDLLNSIVTRKAFASNPDFIANIESLRVDIDSIDKEIITMLSKRMEIVREIGKYKNENGVTILQMNRWSEIFDNRVHATINAGLTEDFAHSFIQDIHNESIRQQNKIMNNGQMD